jgi:hypothetical protein
MQRCRLFIAVGAAFSLLPATAFQAVADDSCNESYARDRLEKLLQVLHQPKAKAAMEAAKADLDADGEIDNPDDAEYLMAAAVFISAKRNLDGGSADGACEILQRSKGLVDQVIAGQ